MASKASRRTNAAAKRGGGFLSRIGNSRVSRQVVAPAVTAASLAAQLHAEQELDRVNTQKPTAAQQASQNIASVPVRGTTGTLRGAKPNPLPSGLNLGARLAASQQQDRMANADSGELADLENADDSTFLESATRSYARPEPTDAEAELGRQRQMRRTARQLLVEGTGPAQQDERAVKELLPEEESAEPGIEVRQADVPLEETEEYIAADLAAQQAEDARALEAQANAAAASEANQADDAFKANKRARAIAKVVQAVSAESIFTLVTLWLQVNLELLNKWIFHIRIPYIMEPDPNPQVGGEEVVMGCTNCTCFGCLIMLIAIFVLMFGLIYIANINPIGTLFDFLRAAFGGLFS